MEALVFSGMKIFFVVLAIFVIIGMVLILFRKSKQDNEIDQSLVDKKIKESDS